MARRRNLESTPASDVAFGALAGGFAAKSLIYDKVH